MYGEAVCVKCGKLFSKTGRNHRTCPTCAAARQRIGERIACRACGVSFVRRGRRHNYCDTCAKQRQKERAYAHRVQRGHIKNPGVGSGNAQGRGPSHHSWKTGIGTYTQYRGSECRRCGSVKHLCTHHQDHDRSNNAPGNLETLCKRCHQLEHNAAQNLPKGKALSQLKRAQAAQANRDSRGRFIK